MKDLKIYISLVLALVVVYLVIQYNKPKEVDWRDSFDKEHKIPFGTYILFQRLNDIFPGARVNVVREPAYLTISEEPEADTGSYLLIARYAKIDQYDFQRLQKYMEQGNNVLIAAYHIGQYLSDTLDIQINSELSDVSLSFTHASLEPQKQYRFNRGIGLQYFSSFDSTKAQVLGLNSKGNANFLKFRYGKGALYILPGPYFFTNYSLLEQGGADYAAKALSYLPRGGHVIWDEFSSLGKEDPASLTHVLIKYPSLRWAYYIALASLLFFVLYEIKRRQRIIPLIVPLQNTTAEFVRVVGRVYYQQRDNSNIARKKVNYLIEMIRSKYNLKYVAGDQAFAPMLIKKSGADAALVADLLRLISQVQLYRNVSDQELIDLNNAIELFYKQSS